MAPKTADKLTDAEKKKVKQANKAKANPGKASLKAETNLKRRIARGQIVDPNIAAGKKVTNVETEETCSVLNAPKPKQTDAEKAERLKIKMNTIEKEFQEKQRLAQKERFEHNLTSEVGNSTTATDTEAY